MNAFIVLICAFFGILSFVNRRKNKTTGSASEVLGVDKIPQPRPFPIKWIGNIPQLWPVSDAINTCLGLCKRYPGLFKATALNKTFVVFTSPAAIHQLFKSAENGHNVKCALLYDLMKPFLTNSVLVAKGKPWQAHRKILMKTQSLPAMKYYMRMLNDHSKNFMQTLEALFEDGQPHEINEHINVLFLRTICDMITGSEHQEDSDWIKFHRNFQTWKQGIIKRIINPWFMIEFLWRFHPMAKKSEKATNEMFEFAQVNIQRHKQNLSRGRDNVGDFPGGENTDFAQEDKSDSEKVKCMLEELLEAGVDDRQIVDEVNGILFGGHETVATAVHFFCLCIALNPTVQKECQREIDELFGNSEFVQSGNISYEGVQGNLKYLERCILEALRIFPPIFGMVRQLESDFKVDVNGEIYEIPAGCNIIIPPIVIHRSSEYYPEPMKFDPDRFLPSEVAKRPACSFIPFSIGLRNCLGIRFSMLEMKLVTAHLLRNFVITTTEKIDVVPLLPNTTLTPARDYVFTLKKRYSGL